MTASTGMSPIVRPGLYGRSSFRIACARWRDAPWRGRGSSARGSRTSSPPALYAATWPTAARGSTAGFVKACAASFEPTTLPSRSIRLPFALSGKASCAKPGQDERGRRGRTRASTRPPRSPSARAAGITWISPSTIGPSVSAGKIIRPAVRIDRRPTSRTTNVGAVRAEGARRTRARSSSPPASRRARARRSAARSGRATARSSRRAPRTPSRRSRRTRCRCCSPASRRRRASPRSRARPG